jgi:hypothetical protein
MPKISGSAAPVSTCASVLEIVHARHRGWAEGEDTIGQVDGKLVWRLSVTVTIFLGR